MWRASDGTCFDTKEQAEEHEAILHNPHYKALKDRLDKLEQDMLGLQLQIASLRTQENKYPFQQPIVRYSPIPMNTELTNK